MNAAASTAFNSKQIEISGITFNVIASKALRAGRVELKLQRPAGRRFYFAVVYENGAVSEAV